MGLFSGMLGLSSEVDEKRVEAELEKLLAPNETVELAYQLVRDLTVLTNRRIILVDKQGITGKRIEYVSIPYKSIVKFTIETVGHFGHPVVFLADNPGVMAGTRAEREGILKWSGKMFRASRRIQAPKIHVTLRKAFGFGMVTMAGTPFDHQTISYSLPGVNLASMPATSGGKAAKLKMFFTKADWPKARGGYRLVS